MACLSAMQEALEAARSGRQTSNGHASNGHASNGHISDPETPPPGFVRKPARPPVSEVTTRLQRRAATSPSWAAPTALQGPSKQGTPPATRAAFPPVGPAKPSVLSRLSYPAPQAAPVKAHSPPDAAPPGFASPPSRPASGQAPPEAAPR